MNIKIFADGASKESMLKRYREKSVHGFTTNPSLMAKAGIKDYEGFARELLQEIRDCSISFEVFSDEFDDMERQALKIKSWGPNIHVKIPITNTKSESSLPLIRRLLDQGLKLNVTALFTERQITALREVLKPQDDVLVSVFAGRLGDTGLDPMPLMRDTVRNYQGLPKAQVLWASTREALNIYQADECGCHIITVPDDLVDKLKLKGKDLTQYSLETVKGFYQDAQKAGFKL